MKPAAPRPIASAPSAEAVHAQLERILASNGFARSERLSRFLRFAVEKKLRGEGDQLKEYLLGVEVFDRDATYDPRLDPIVRVEAARLRAKIRDYYRTEGENDPVRIDFGKGSYAPILATRMPGEDGGPQPAAPARRDAVWNRAALILLAGLACAALVWALRLNALNAALASRLAAGSGRALEPDFAPFWGPFFSDQAPNYVVFGSPMFFSSDRLGLFLRRPSLNDPNNFLPDPRFKELQDSFGPLGGPRFDYAEMGDALALQRLTLFFGRRGGTLTALPAHSATWDSIKAGNIIFLGTPRMNPLLRKLPVEKDFEWGADDKIYNRKPLPGEQESYATSSNRDSATYVVLAAYPGLEPGRRVLLLMSHSGPGARAAVDYLTRPDSVRQMRERLRITRPEQPGNFQMLLRVAVDNNVPVKTEYVTHHEITNPPKN